MTANLDRRLNAFRPDLADQALAGQVSATDFAIPRTARVCVPVAGLATQPDQNSGLDSQLLYGEPVKVFDETGGWSWVQSAWDGYVGYVRSSALGASKAEPTHRATALTTFVYQEPDLKTPVVDHLSMGSVTAIVAEQQTRGVVYGERADGGFVVMRHVTRMDDFATDYVRVAEAFEQVPYLWAGRSGFGVDCSGLVQLCMAMAGLNVLRDSDMQENSIGDALDLKDHMALKRGDLVFWKGHVGIMTDGQTLLHANGHSMDTRRERLEDAIARIEPLFGRPTSIRRPPAVSIRPL